MATRTPKSAEELSARFDKHFPKGRDLTLIILKSHLLVEEQMNELLALSLPNPDFIYRARLGFLQRLRVLQALRGDAEFHALAEAIELLNETRNSLAHQLEPVKPQALIPRFIEAAFNAATRNAKPLGAKPHQSASAPVKYSRIALGQAIGIAVGLLGYQIRQHAKRAA